MEEGQMIDVLIPDVDEEVIRRLSEKAVASGRSLNDMALEALRQFVKPSREELIEEARRISAMSPYSDVDSTDLIREDRENDEPYR
jgi:plasmid stability protein